jgi:hypothetical protein
MFATVLQQYKRSKILRTRSQTVKSIRHRARSHKHEETRGNTRKHMETSGTPGNRERKISIKKQHTINSIVQY